ncbi:MAG: hypothetical protein P4N59_16675 [Negativicutes bacterium]|nr:hypothetical protein [Negativicutes bacterium]
MSFRGTDKTREVTVGDQVRILAGDCYFGYRGIIKRKLEPIFILLTDEFCDLYEVTMTAPQNENGQQRVFPMQCLISER